MSRRAGARRAVGRRRPGAARPVRTARRAAEKGGQRLARTLDVAGMAIWDCELPGRRLRCTAQGGRLFGVETGRDGEVELSVVLSRLHPEDAPQLEGALARALARPDEAQSVQVRVGQADGQLRWLEIRGQAFARADGRGVGGVRGSVVDVTERREAEQLLRESEERFRGLAEAAFEAIFVHERGIIVDVNRAMCDLSGFSCEELVGRNGFELIAPEYRELAYRSLLSEREESYEIEAFTRDGRRVPVEVRARSFLYRGRVLRVVSVRDLTAKRREAAVRDSLLRELEARNVELDRFGTAVSHGLKGPLITIRGFADHLEGDARAGRTDRLAADAARIREAVGRLQRMLDELQAYSRAGHPVGPPVAVPAGDLVREALRLLDTRLEGALPRLDVPGALPLVYGDRARLVHMFEQLLAHAARDARGGQATVRIEQEPPREGQASLRVSARSAEGDALFGALDAADPWAEGAAVTLGLVKRIVESHGGRVWRSPSGASPAGLHLTLPQPPATREGALRESAGRPPE